MTITIRSGDPGGWTRVPHTLARDPRLSNGARGLAVQMLSHADGFRSDEEFLAQHTADDRDAVRRQLAELRRYGYLVRHRVQGPDGKLTTRSVLYDVPQHPEPPAEEPPSRGKPATRSDQGRFTKPAHAPDAGNPRHGTTGHNTAKPQVEPTRGQPATRADQAKHANAAGQADSRETRVHIEDQREDQKKISQSAQDRQAARRLHALFRLTDSEAAQVIKEVRRRAARPITNLVPYMAGMAEGDLADIVAAAMDATDAVRASAAAAATPRQRRDRTVAEAIADATPGRQEHEHALEHVDGATPGNVTRLDIRSPECPHGHPGGASPWPDEDLPSCGPCRAHTIACTRPPATCSTCHAIAAARSGARGRRQSA
ncbi:helix-turn-helix domain-containing protein [Sphaerisporangium sp. NPDC088356]|uniref:helix-turn-helix domain-containing protein n=1 Tax=Sphaerisporangium sp. NPDC088356 TaxID=3154871 RepID=UPI00344302EB